MHKRNPALIIGVITSVFLLVGIVLFLSRNIPALKNSAASSVGTIILQKDGTTFSLDSTGNAMWVTPTGTTSALWSSDKTNSFFAYYQTNWSQNATVQNGTATVNNPGNDELATAVISEGSGGSGGNGGGSGGGGDVSQYFGSPTPTPVGGSDGSGGTGGSGGDNGAPSWCKHWRLSYCADPPPDTSTPIPTASPVPGQATPLPPDCNDPGNQQTGRTVIGNELCLPSPTPTATP